MAKTPARTLAGNPGYPGDTKGEKTGLPKPAADFLIGMAKHHQMGFPMCEDYLSLPASDQNPEVSRLARTILGQLKDQAAEMTRILKKHGVTMPKGPMKM